MHTEIVPLNPLMATGSLTPGLAMQKLMRETPLASWLSTPALHDRLSGTLVKTARVGMAHRGLLTHEALCQTLGWGFESAPSTLVNFNTAMTEGDCHAITEVGWHVDRIMHVWPHPEDRFEVKYLVIQDQNSNTSRQGVGLVLRETSVQWVPPGHLVFALLAEFDPKTQEWSECTNPF